MTEFSDASEPVVPGEFVNRIYHDEQGDHKYAVFLPKAYSEERSWPVIVWLHGASARGTDGRAPLVAGIGPNIARRRETFPFIVVFPQCESLQTRLLGGWTDERTDADRALKILEAVEHDFRIDPQRRILAGVSMGAFGVWSVGARSSHLWSAMVPVSGGGPLTLSEQLKTIPVWAFHAADDQVVPPEASYRLVDAIKQRGGRAFYTELPNGGHNIGSRVFAKDEIYDWLLTPDKSPQHPDEWPIDRTSDLQLQNEVKFVPGAEVDRAIHVHLGTDVLEALAFALPDQVPSEALSGSRGPQSELKTNGWMRFQVTVPGVQYSGELRMARLEILPENRVRLRLGFHPLTMTLLGTEIQGRLLRASAGAVQVVIGVREPAWLDVVVVPRIESRRLKFDLVSADFPIAPGNWYVTEPAGIQVRPFPGLRGRISRQITDGVYAKQGEISQQVVAGVPRILEQIEQRAQEQFDRTITFGRWPMPVWQPRAKFWPSEITTDEGGLTIQLGVTLAALAPQADTVPMILHPGPQSLPPQSTQGVSIAIAKDVVSTWTELLARSEVRRFYVQDFHASEFHEFADPKFLARIIPNWNRLPRGSQFRSVLSFEQPMELSAVGSPNTNHSEPDSKLRLAGRELRLTVSERPSPHADWTSLAEFPIQWHQDFQIVTEKASHRSRLIQISSLAAPEVVSSGKILDSRLGEETNVNSRLVAEQFRRGWEATFTTSLAKKLRLPERVLGGVPFLCDSLGIKDDYLVVQLRTPTTQIENVSSETLTYELQYPGGPWSTSYVLQPGKMHEFASPTTMNWRSQSSGLDLRFTLPLGSVNQYHGGTDRPLRLDVEVPVPAVAATPQIQIQ